MMRTLSQFSYRASLKINFNMNAKTKSSKLLCSISSGDVTEPVMRVFDVDLKEEDERGFCSS